MCGRRDHSEPTHTTPKIAVGTEPSTNTGRASPVARPRTVPMAMPANGRGRWHEGVTGSDTGAGRAAAPPVRRSGDRPGPASKTSRSQATCEGAAKGGSAMSPTLPGISASNRAPPTRMRWHFRAVAAPEDSTQHVHFRVMPRMLGLRYLRLTDLSNADDSSASGESYLLGGLT
jgi:hypothetical protein